MNYLYYNESLLYPDHKYNYSPSVKYPEYTGTDIAEERNDIYDSIRRIFLDIGYDKENYGTEYWNPLGEKGAGIIPGDTVLIKPNWVLHENLLENHKDSLDCLVTHPSILRCIIDYVLIALNGDGKIYVGDSPVKGCSLKKLWENHHYDCVMNYFKEKDIEWVDLRGPSEERDINAQLSGVVVDIGENSYFYEYKNQKGLRIPNYDYHKVIKHHCGVTQEYCVNELVVRANVIINLPKPKSHRKSGFTGALKNFVGINYNKEYLPHHTIGDIKNGGDEFFAQTPLKKAASFFFEKRDIRRTKINKNNYSKDLKYKLLDKLYSITKKIDEMTFQNEGIFSTTQGTWYGNDTLWRTVLDLNQVVHYSDSNGELKEQKQRKVITICDMVVSGEKEGPLSPSPKDEHIILFGENVVEVDAIVVKIMHFKIEKLQSINVALHDQLLEACGIEEITVLSNMSKYNGVKIEDVDFAEFSPFVAATGWAGYIEE